MRQEILNKNKKILDNNKKMWYIQIMPTTINPIRKARVKKSLLEGKSIRQSLKDAGYSERVAHGNCDKDFPVVKSCMSEIRASLRAADITPDWLLRRFATTQAAAFQTRDFSTALAADIAIAKFVAQIAEKHDFQFSPEEKNEFSRIRALIQLNITAKPEADQPQISTQPVALQEVKV